MYDREPAVEENGNPSWGIEKQCLIPKEVSDIGLGTIRSPKCTRMTVAEDSICCECRKVPYIRSFRARVVRYKEQPALQTRDDCMTKMQQRKKLSHLETLMDKAQFKEVQMRKTIKRIEQRKVKVTDLFEESINRADVLGIVSNLKLANDKGMLDEKSKLLSFLKTLTANLSRSSKGKRYDEFTKELYYCLSVIGGPRIVKFVSANLSGPADGTVRALKRKTKQPLVIGMKNDPFIHAATAIKGIMDKHGISSPVLVELSQDETVIQKMLQWMPQEDIIVGACGQKGPEHKCIPGYHMVLGNDEHSYERLTEFFQTSVIAHNAHVSILNPLHPKLPSVAIFLMATCNTFTHQDSLSLWQDIEARYLEHVFPAIHCPLASRGSDGDSRRRKAMEIKAYGNHNEIPYTVDCDTFTVSGDLKKDDQGNVYSVGISNQDYIHCGKKLTYPLDHASRTLNLGGHLVHMSHLELVTDLFPILEHGLRKEDVERQDRQNWSSAQRMFFPKVRDCLQIIQRDNTRPHDVLATIAYLEICWLFVEIFCSFEATLLQRVEHASTVTNFLRIWRWWVYNMGNLTLREHFLTRQCFQDVILSCHAAVLLIKASRDFAPNHPVYLSMSGSDCCEDFFSQNGSFVMNKHTYSFGDMLQNQSSMNSLLRMRASSTAPVIPKGHKKQENIWNKGNKMPIHKPDLMDWPTDTEIEDAWNRGLACAQAKCRKLGVFHILFKITLKHYCIKLYCNGQI